MVATRVVSLPSVRSNCTSEASRGSELATLDTSRIFLSIFYMKQT